MANVINETRICNMGLSSAGAKNLIADYNTLEDSEEWRMCTNFLWQAIHEVLALGQWGFATDRIELAQDANAPAFGPYDYRYELPLDLIAIIHQVDETSDDIHYDHKREGRYLLTNEETCFLRYVKKIDNVAYFPPLFVKAVYTNLAVLVRNRLKGADEWYLRLYRELKLVVSDALAASEMEDYVEEGNNDVLESAT